MISIISYSTTQYYQDAKGKNLITHIRGNGGQGESYVLCNLFSRSIAVKPLMSLRSIKATREKIVALMDCFVVLRTPRNDGSDIKGFTGHANGQN